MNKDSKIAIAKSVKIFDKYVFFNNVAGICWEQGLNETDAVNILAILFSSIIDKHAPILSQFGLLSGTAHG